MVSKAVLSLLLVKKPAFGTRGSVTTNKKNVTSKMLSILALVGLD